MWQDANRGEYRVNVKIGKMKVGIVSVDQFAMGLGSNVQHYSEFLLLSVPFCCLRHILYINMNSYSR